MILGGLNIPLFSATSSAIALKDLLRQVEKSIGWQPEIIKRDILAMQTPLSTMTPGTSQGCKLQLHPSTIS